ncbi:conserved exported hypothetical protein [Paraburkholderia piptadeniae]|uniref:Uncharacterized protein n=1 Tax=Paraburkholderia piptadeniae TaxID=1701573 RepID=A0A1N7SUK9_9BURK|nr:hypothetical protein [Paraburkholderia piptadeniae]SIT51156.1 conserved exported hypothetical protein [Paraburkholderia piptadeniae]
MKDARSLLFSRRGWLKTACGVAAGAALGSLGLLSREARAQGSATIYPIDNWLNVQGTAINCSVTCQLPPTPDFVDWNSREVALHNAPTPPIYVATVDYADLENQHVFGGALGTKIDKQNSKVIVQPLSDGSGNVQVRVLLYTQNANTWVIPLHLVDGVVTPSFGAQLLGNDVFFGLRDASLPLSGACLGNSFLDVTYVTSASKPFVDLVTFLSTPGLQTANFRAQATGPFTPIYLSQNGLPSGTRGRCTISETGLLSVTSNSHSRVSLDSFPAEVIDLHPVG